MTIIKGQSAYYYLRAAPILNRRFMESAATQAKRKEIVTSKEIEVARRTEFGRTNFAATYQKNFYRTGMSRSGLGEREREPAPHDFAKTHL